MLMLWVASWFVDWRHLCHIFLLKSGIWILSQPGRVLGVWQAEESLGAVRNASTSEQRFGEPGLPRLDKLLDNFGT